MAIFPIEKKNKKEKTQETATTKREAVAVSKD